MKSFCWIYSSMIATYPDILNWKLTLVQGKSLHLFMSWCHISYQNVDRPHPISARIKQNIANCCLDKPNIRVFLVAGRGLKAKYNFPGNVYKRSRVYYASLSAQTHTAWVVWIWGELSTPVGTWPIFMFYSIVSFALAFLFGRLSGVGGVH